MEKVELIKQWAKDRNLQTGKPEGQMLKLLEEAGELASGIAKSNDHVTRDSVGDIFVVLTVLCLQLDIDIEECIDMAYDEIKDRKGKLINGVFVKEEDLKKISNN
ncbi:DNA-binding protein [Staphylococcus phage LJT-1]|nr:DNA-binding protein [Staphylococcus phage LJT-1]